MYYILYICTVHCTYTYSIHYQRLKSLQLNPDRLFVIKMICQNFQMIVNKAGLYWTVIQNVPYVQILYCSENKRNPNLKVPSSCTRFSTVHPTHNPPPEEGPLRRHQLPVRDSRHAILNSLMYTSSEGTNHFSTSRSAMLREATVSFRC